MKSQTICSELDCKRTSCAKGLCKMHYMRMYWSQNNRKAQNSDYHREAWYNMKARCYNNKSRGYENYGGRGIKVCDSWLNDFTSFKKDIGDRPTESHSLDRIDNTLDYSPSNCRWSDKTTQVVNRRKFKSNTSGHTGVYILKTSFPKKYKALLIVHGKIVECSYHFTLEGAMNARKNAELLHHSPLLSSN